MCIGQNKGLGAGRGLQHHYLFVEALQNLAQALADEGMVINYQYFQMTYPAWIFIMSGTISRATILMILISGLIAGPAVSL